MKYLPLFALVLSSFPTTAVFADVVGPSGKAIDCFYTEKIGSRIELGQSICLSVGGRMFMARCEMSLNVAMWQETQNGCVPSSLIQRLQHLKPIGNPA